MNYRGINYDVGTKTLAGTLTREIFDLNDVAREIGIIKNTLRCNAIRVSGLDIQRVAEASAIALQEGLTVWFSPALHYGNQADTMQYIIQGARAAEMLRRRFGNLVFVTGCELTLFTRDFVRGDTGEKRIRNLFNLLSMVKNLIGVKRRYNILLKRFLRKGLREVRKEFHGPVTYASGTWEKIEWGLFDIIGVDYYRAAYNKSTFRKDLQKYKVAGKPLSIMEFGCCTYKGAGDKGAMGWAIVDWKKERPQLKGHFIRDEKEQADYLEELLNIFEEEGVAGSFVFTFITPNYLHHDDPVYDLDMASYGIVKAIENRSKGYGNNMPWIPKLAFYRLADHYARQVDTSCE